MENPKEQILVLKGMIMKNQEQDLKAYKKLKEHVILLVENYIETKSEDIKNKLLNILEVESGARIDIRKPSYWSEEREFDRYKVLPNILTNLYTKERKNTRIRFSELYKLAEVIFDDTTQT